MRYGKFAPKAEDFGYEPGGPWEEGGWILEGGREAYYNALERWNEAQGYVLLDMVKQGEAVPATVTLEHILAALKIIAQIIPIIDGLMPTFIRWWKEIFGTKEEREAVRSFKVLKKAEAIIKNRINAT